MQVQHLAEDYANGCTGPDTNMNNTATPSISSSSGEGVGCGIVGGGSVVISASGSGRSMSGPEECEVYVWGSNNSHQLAEGSQEKILTPKLTSTFRNCQQVRALFKLKKLLLNLI